MVNARIIKGTISIPGGGSATVTISASAGKTLKITRIKLNVPYASPDQDKKALLVPEGYTDAEKQSVEGATASGAGTINYGVDTELYCGESSNRLQVYGWAASSTHTLYYALVGVEV